jgi:hypothetical protein
MNAGGESSLPKDRHGRIVRVGSQVRLLELDVGCLTNLLPDERLNVLSMVGEVFEVEEIDEYGQSWVRKTWAGEEEGTCFSHSFALQSAQMELVDEVRPFADVPG